MMISMLPRSILRPQKASFAKFYHKRTLRAGEHENTCIEREKRESMEMWEREDDKNHGSTPGRVSEEMSVEESERELECE